MRKLTICMYGAASDMVDNVYIDGGVDLGAEIAKRGHRMIYGAGASGLMGACARGVKANGGEIIGVAPEFMSSIEPLFSESTEFIATKTMAERKEIMEENADAFVICPGGIGTMDEFFQILTLSELKQKNGAPIILYNINGFYDHIIQFINDSIQSHFIRPVVSDLFSVSDSPKEIIDIIEEKVVQTN